MKANLHTNEMAEIIYFYRKDEILAEYVMLYDRASSGLFWVDWQFAFVIISADKATSNKHTL